MGLVKFLRWITIGIVGGFIIFANLPRGWYSNITSSGKLNEPWLAQASLRRLDPRLLPDPILADILWKATGAVILIIRRAGDHLCRQEAKALSNHHREFEEMNVPLIGLLNEDVGAKDLQNYFKGNLYMDVENRFFGPQNRKMHLMGYFRVPYYLAVIKAIKHNITGTLKGDGSRFGGVVVLGHNHTGIQFRHRERFFGDTFNVTRVMKAVYKVVEDRNKMNQKMKKEYNAEESSDEEFDESVMDDPDELESAAADKPKELRVRDDVRD